MDITMIMILMLTGIGLLLCIVVIQLYKASRREERKLEDITHRLSRAMSIHSKLKFL